jgi:hypothetical protein
MQRDLKLSKSITPRLFRIASYAVRRFPAVVRSQAAQ